MEQEIDKTVDKETLLKEFNAYLDKQYAYYVAQGVCVWDTRTDAPKGGAGTRAKALAMLQSEYFNMCVSPEMKRFIDGLSPFKDELSDADKAKLRICAKRYNDNMNVPPEFYKKVSEHVIKAEEVWESAKNNNDFAAFAPYLEKNIEYTKQLVKYQKPDCDSPYNALLDNYEPDLTTAELDEFFGKLRAKIVPLLKKITEKGRKLDERAKNIPVPIDTQRKLSRLFAEMVGYDFERGMVKEVEHPFSLTLSKYDSRISTHYYEDAFLSSVYSILHESGHSIYEQGKMDEIAESIIDDGVSMAIHESQSRFYENIIGRSPEFWAFAWPKAQAVLGPDFADITAENMFEAANTVKPSLIRIEADELTYALHIMVRYEIEKELFAENSTLAVADLPRVWNEKYAEYLGVTPQTDKEGVLQDVHWSGAMFGYFPSYALGNAYGAHLLHYMRQEFDFYKAVEDGDFAKITGWLNEKIHKYGSIYEPRDLFAKIAGESLNYDYFNDYLEQKFTKLYGI